MTKRFFAILIAIIALGSLLSAETKLDRATLNKITESSAVLKGGGITLKEGIDLGTVYFLKLESSGQRGTRISFAFYDKQSGALYEGRGFDKNGQPYIFPKDVQTIKDGIAFSYGTGSKHIYLVTDPECPYCVKFEKVTHGKLGDYTVHVILYPLPFHKNAPMMVEWIMKGKDDAEKHKRLEAITFNGSQEYLSIIEDKSKPFAYSPQVLEQNKKAQAATREIGARGTPAVFDENFAPINWSELLTKPTNDGVFKIFK
jgi:thiol:disulfide interchange protein DsbC